jgi:adenylate cyclase class 2
MAKEVEIKFRIANMDAVIRSLGEVGFKRITPSMHEMNTLYDLPGQKLRKRGEMLRLRKYGESWVLTHKAKGETGRHKSRVELETEVRDGNELDGILRALQFQPVFRYEKYRAEWGDGTGHVVLDETPIGNFGEIEGPPRWIDRTARALEIQREAYVTQTYAPLFFEWKRKTRSKAEEMTFHAVGIKPKRQAAPRR